MPLVTSRTASHHALLCWLIQLTFLAKLGIRKSRGYYLCIHLSVYAFASGIVCVCVRVCGRALAAWVCCSRRHASESGPVEGEERSWRYSLGKPQARRADWTALRHHVSHVLNSFHWKLANTEGDPSLLLSASLFLSFLALLCSLYPIQTDVIETRGLLKLQTGLWNGKQI